MHGKGERETLARVTSALLASCMDTMAKLIELVGIMGWKEGSRARTTRREGIARGCSWAAHLVLR
jgi:hypothetical protein